MSRATSKTELIAAANQNYEKMISLFHALPEEGKKAAFDFSNLKSQKEAHWKRDKNMRDVLVHLYEWHQLLLNWIESNQKGEAAPFLPAPYNWKTYGDMNVELWQKHQSTTLEDAANMLGESHVRVMTLIESFSNEELFTKGFFSWTGGNALGSYCVSATASHYDWAIKKIKAHSKTLQ